MPTRVRTELEAPPLSHVITGAICSVISFFSLPFLLWRISEGFYDDPFMLSWFEIGFHLLNFTICFFLFREYLEDSLLNMQLNKEKFITVVSVSAGLILAIALIFHVAFRFIGSELLYVAAFGAAPITEMDVLVLSGTAAVYNPIFTTACSVLITPVITGCLFYAIGFCYFYNIHPLLSIVTICFAAGFPRLCSAATWWVADQQLVLYLAQLPAHLICCWAYKKTDTVWAPIVILMAVNLIACIVTAIAY